MPASALAVEEPLENLEVELLLEGVHRHYGLDFRGYTLGSLKRRVWRRVYGEGLSSVSGLQERVLHDPAVMDRLLGDLSINVTTMFRDPGFFLAFRERIVPLLRTYPFLRFWSAGCSTGEEVYSLAILLREAGLYERSRIYATDMSEPALTRARLGEYPLERMREYTENYLCSGGTEQFVRYYDTDERVARFDPSLLENVVFAQHNLVSDGSFNRFNVILCRNVLIYFRRVLHERVHGLFSESLERLGVLGLGRTESMRYSVVEGAFEVVDPVERLYRRTR